MKIYHYEKYLQRKSLTEKEARNLLFKFQSDEEDKRHTKISNVIDENTQLREELKDAFKDLNEAQSNLKEKNKKIKALEAELKEIKTARDT